MTAAPSVASPAELLLERKQTVAAIRNLAQTRLDDGSKGVLIAATLADRIQEFISQVAEETILHFTPSHLERLRNETAVVGVGGTGRGSVAPYSDVDLMLLTSGRVTGFDEVVAAFVQSIWDSGLKLGQSVRTVDGGIRLAIEDEKTATSFVQTRLIWGSEKLHTEFSRKFSNQILHRRKFGFVAGCVRARLSEFPDGRPTLQELQPNVKTSHGGLRDLHLISWIAAAYYGTYHLDVLQLQQVLTPDDASRLREAEEFLLRLRIRMHLAASAPEDTLTRSLQLSLAEEEGYEDTETQRGVEHLMQDYFRHTSAIASIADRFVNLHERPPWHIRAARSLFRRRSSTGLLIGPRSIDVSSDNTTAADSLEKVVDIYERASARNLNIQPQLTETIRAAALHLGDDLTANAAAKLRKILSRPGTLPYIMRHMHDTGILDHVIPQYRPIRSLLQFNQYHDFTVDEHTLRAVETVCSFATDDGPLGRAYQRIRERDVLHLSVFLHDIGKGREEDHSILGGRLADEVGERLGYSEAARSRLSTLVIEHLEMADLAFRRDISDQSVLIQFANRLGSPTTLISLYLLTAADIMSVGPGVWTPWKAELLADLFERTMVIVSGRNYGGFEEEQNTKLKRRTSERPPSTFEGSKQQWEELVDSEFDRFPTHYLASIDAERFARDLAVVASLDPDETDVSGAHDDTTGITEYRVVMPRTIGGCFQNMCAVLTARNCEIFAAEIATTTDGFVIDRFRVRDRDFVADDQFSDDDAPESDLLRRTGPQVVPQSRINEMTALLKDVLVNEKEAQSLFARFERFDTYLEDEELPSGLETRVEIDNDTSSNRTIVDVFTRDRRGLLYFIAKTLGELKLSIDLAKIATHFDQVVDVFYVTERDGTKLTPERADDVKRQLSERMTWFEDQGYREFRRR